MNEHHICKSCGNTFYGPYCNECGEKVLHQEDRTLRYFLGELINALTFADTKLLVTLKSILLTPGQFSSDWTEGKRRFYMKPISVFFLANFLYFLIPIYNTFNTNLHIQTHAFQNLHSPLAERWVDEKIAQLDISYEEYETAYDAKSSELSKLLLIALVVFMVIFFWLIHWGGERKLMADHLTVSFELMTFVILFALQVIGALIFGLSMVGMAFLNSEMYLSSIMLLVLCYFLFRMERIFYRFNIGRSVINSLLCLISFIIVLYAYRVLLFFTTFWVL
ncbi:MAG: DUF3667 domain-containing protein [Marinoscillum sp.]